MPKNGAAGKAIKRLYLAAVRRIQMSELALDSASFSLPQREATFATCDLEESAHYVSIGSLHTLRPLKANPEVDLAVWRCSLQQTHLDVIRLTCGSEFWIDRTSETNHFMFQFPLSGVCAMESEGMEAIASPGELLVLNPRQRALKRWRGHCSQLMVQVDRGTLERVLAAELGHECGEPLVFDLAVHDRGVAQALSAVTQSVWRDFIQNAALGQWRIVRAFERNLLVAFLGALRHNYSDELNLPATPAAPYYVKRAEDFIRANLRNRIEIEDLVAIAGVSSRSLYYGFRRWRGTTPMNYLRQVRLSAAHEELKKARDDGNNVTRIALGVGYDHLSRFSKDYKQRFGQSPSTTMLHAS